MAGTGASFRWARRSRLARASALLLAAAVFVHLFRFLWLVGNRRICFTGPVMQDIANMCAWYKNGSISGDLCEAACGDGGDSGDRKSFEVVECQGNHYWKSTVFAARLRGEDVIVKFASASDFTPVPPSKSWLNLWSGSVGELRGMQLENVWLQHINKEQYITEKLDTSELFPSVVASCGSAYAVLRAEKVRYPTFVSNLGDEVATATVWRTWEYRLYVALKMLDLLSRVSSAPGAPYSICDLKYQHFGLLRHHETQHPKDGSSPDASFSVVMLDADHFYPKYIADAIVNSTKDCVVDSDCDHFDCGGRCEPRSKRCLTRDGVKGSNLKILCEKIFIGRYRLENFKYAPGLLESPLASQDLLTAINACADQETPDMDALRRILVREVETVRGHL